MKSLSKVVKAWRMRLAGHVDGRQTCKRSHELDTRRWQETKRKPQKTWHVTFTEDLQGFGVTWRGAKRVTSDRQTWRNLVTRCSNDNWRN